MRLRRLITLSVVGALLIAVVSVFGIPRVISDQVAQLPESIQKIADRVTPEPVTILNPHTQDFWANVPLVRRPPH